MSPAEPPARLRQSIRLLLLYLFQRLEQLGAQAVVAVGRGQGIVTQARVSEGSGHGVSVALCWEGGSGIRQTPQWYRTVANCDRGRCVYHCQGVPLLQRGRKPAGQWR